MTLGKITVDNEVGYVRKNSNSQSEQTQDSKPTTRKNDSIPR